MREFNFEVRDLFKTTKSFSCDVWIKYAGHITKLPIEVQVRGVVFHNMQKLFYLMIIPGRGGVMGNKFPFPEYYKYQKLHGHQN